MNKLEANINIKDFEEFKVSHDILCEMLQDKNINVGIRLKYMRECNNKIEKDSNMNVPFVKVNNLKEFERVVAKMEMETGLKLDGYITDIYTVVGLNDIHSKITTWNEKFISDKIISADEYLTGIIENFTLDYLEDGMVVEYRNGERRLFMYDSFIGIGSYGDIENYNENFSHNQEVFELDVVKIYKLYSFKGGFDGLFDERNLTLIFDAEAYRNKSKVSQRKSEIENEIKKLQEELNLLEVK